MKDKAFIWDLDGTLLDSYPVIVASVYKAYREAGIKLDPKEIHEYVITYSVMTYIQKMTDSTGVSFDRIKERYSQFGEQMIGEIGLIPNAEEALKALADKGAKHYIFSHRGRNAEDILKRLGIYDCFEEIVTSENHFARKPEPDAILYLAEKYGLRRDQTYYVGDRTIDMHCAENAGSRGILYLPDGTYCRPDGSETWIVHDLRDIADLDLG